MNARNPLQSAPRDRRARRSVESTREGDGPARLGELGEHVVWIVAAEQSRDLVREVTAEHVLRAPGNHVDRVPHVHERLRGVVDGAVRAVREPRRRERGEADEVASAAARLLEIGLDEVRDLAEALDAHA